jgi:tetratricopeptide (TPR) repeat protein
LDKAEKFYTAILATRPNNFDALHMLGTLLARQGRNAEALVRMSAALKLNPTSVEVFSNIGVVHAKLGHPAEALASFDKALALRPASPELLNKRGNALKDLKRPVEALASYDEAIEHKPDYAEALNNRGTALLDLKRPLEALASFDKAVALKPTYVKAFNNRGTALRVLRRPEEALASYDRALMLNPSNAKAHNNKGILLIELGRFDEAYRSIERAIELDPQNASFYYSLATSKRLALDDPKVRAMKVLAQDPSSLSVDSQIYLHFALSKILAEAKDHEQSFDHLLRGNALKRRQIVYDEAAALGLFGRARTVFTDELMRRNAGLGNPSCAPVFILGMPRSGTTLVEQILASHPQVSGAGEVDDFHKVAVALHFPNIASDNEMSTDQLHQVGKIYLDGIRDAAPEAMRIIDKTPANFRFAGLIHLVLPNARIIHTRRDPIDTCLSCFSTLFTEGNSYSYDLQELGRYYRGYEALMAHWRSVLPPNVMLEVQYEDIVTDLEHQARRIVAHCGLEWDDACLDFHKTQRPIRTASATQVRQPIYKSSVGRWRAYEPLLEPLLAELSLHTSAPMSSRHSETLKYPALDRW